MYIYIYMAKNTKTSIYLTISIQLHFIQRV